MGAVFERYAPIPVGVNSTVTSGTNSIGGFLCVTSGAITVSTTGALQGVSTATTLFTNFPVTAGTYYPMPFVTIGGVKLVASSGASGVLGVV